MKWLDYDKQCLNNFLWTWYFESIQIKINQFHLENLIFEVFAYLWSAFFLLLVYLFELFTFFFFEFSLLGSLSRWEVSFLVLVVLGWDETCLWFFGKLEKLLSPVKFFSWDCSLFSKVGHYPNPSSWIMLQNLDYGWRTIDSKSKSPSITFSYDSSEND